MRARLLTLQKPMTMALPDTHKRHALSIARQLVTPEFLGGNS